ncbi:MAG: hypothetical protein GC191_12140 [Azospirillum sp.]|nr:hypothetical protein [Azospirillum sp.]
MTAVLWPLSFQPAEAEFFIATLTSTFVNPFTNQVQVLERDGARWVARLTLRLAYDRTRAFEAFLAGLRGPAGELLVPDFRRLEASGSVAGAPVLAAGTGRTLSVTGFASGATGVLKAGDLIQTSPGRMHQVIEDIDADASGNASVRVEPRLRDPVVVGPLVTSTVRCRMRLTSDEAGRNRTQPPLKAEYQIDLVEVLTP